MQAQPQIVEALFKRTYTIPDRVKLARHAWLTTSCHIRGKHQVLVDWTCSQLDASKVKHGSDDTYLLWSFLSESMEALAEAQDSTRDSCGKQTISPVTLRNAVAQYIIGTMTASVAAVKAQEVPPKHLGVALSCMQALVSCPQLAPAVINRVERLVDMIVVLCELLAASNGSAAGESWPRDARRCLCKLLAHFLTVQHQQTNRKKVFMLAVEKLLGPLLVHYGRLEVGQEKEASSENNESDAIEETKLIKSVLSATLFDKEHLAQIPSVLSLSLTSPSADASGAGARKKTRVEEKLHGATSYCHKLFVTLRELVCQSADSACKWYQWPSLIYELFMEAARSEKSRPSAADLPFFYQMVSLLDLPVVSATDDGCKMETISVQLTEEKCLCLLRLLSIVGTNKAYKAVDDQVTGNRHLAWMQCAVKWLVTGDVERSIVCKTLLVIWDLNHRAVEKHLELACGLVWKSVDGNSSGTECLLLQFTETYGKLGQLDRLVASLLPAAASSPFRGLPRAFEQRFSQLVQLMSGGWCREVWNSFTHFFTGALASLEQRACEPQRKRSKKTVSNDMLGISTASALFTSFLANVHLSSVSVVSDVLELLRDTHSKVLVPLLSLCKTHLACGSLAPCGGAIISSCLYISHAVGQVALFLHCAQGDGLESAIPVTVLSELVLPMQPQTVSDGHCLVIPRDWGADVESNAERLLEPGILLQLRLLAMQWLRVQVVKEGRGAGDRAATDVKMDVDSDDDDSVGDGVQQEILDFVVNVCPSKSTESVTWLGPLAVTSEVEANSAQLRLLMSHFSWISLLCQPSHWSTLGSRLVSTMSAGLAPVGSPRTVGESTRNLSSSITISDQCRQFLQSPAAQESRQLHSSLFAAAVKDFTSSTKRILKDFKAGRDINKLLKAVSKDCTACVESPSTIADSSSETLEKFSSLLSCVMSADRDCVDVCNLTQETDSAKGLWSAVDLVIMLAEVLPTYYLTPRQLASVTCLLLLIDFLGSCLPAAAEDHRSQCLRCLSLLANVLDKCSAVTDTRSMERSRRTAILGCLPPFTVCLQFLTTRLASLTATSCANGLPPLLKFFASLFNLALAHGPVGTEVTSIVQQLKDVTPQVVASQLCISGALKVLDAKASSTERRAVATDVCKGLIKKQLSTSVESFTNAQQTSAQGTLGDMPHHSCSGFIRVCFLAAIATDSSKLKRRVSSALETVLPAALEVLRLYFNHSPSKELQSSVLVQTNLSSIMDLTRAALTHAATLDVALEPELYKSYWEVLCRLACTSRSSSCHSSGLSGSGAVVLAIARSMPLDVWSEVLSSYMSPKALTAEWINLSTSLLQADMSTKHRHDLCVAMVKVLPTLSSSLAKHSFQDMELDDAIVLAKGFLTFAASLALHGKIHLGTHHVGMVLQLCNTIPLLARTQYLLSVITKVGDVIHILLKHHTVATATHVPVLLGACQRLMEALMALSAVIFTQTRQEVQPPQGSAESTAAVVQPAASQGKGEQMFGDPLALKSMAEAFARVLESIAAKKTYAKYTPHFLASYLSFATQYPMPSHAKSAILAGVYAMLASCGPHELSLLKATVGRHEQELFDSLYNDFKKFFKYSGKI